MPVELALRRRLAVQRYLEGDSAEEVADFFRTSLRSVRRWVAAFRRHGDDGLGARPVSGRPPKLSDQQEREVLAWLQDNPTDHGFPNELWTAQRIGVLVGRHWGIRFNRRYLSAWLRARDITPQKPQRVPRERNPKRIAHWLATDWPRIQKKCVGDGLPWS